MAADDVLRAIATAAKNVSGADALTRLLPTAVPEEVAAPVRLSLGEALTRPGYVPRPDDWDVKSLRGDLSNWGVEEQYRIASALRDDYVRRQANDYRQSVADELLSDYFPDYGFSIRNANEIRPRVNEAYAQFGDVIDEDAPKTKDEFLDLVEELTAEEKSRLDIDNEDIGLFIDLADETDNAVRAYSAFDSIKKRMDELPEDNPLRRRFSYGSKNFVPSVDMDYWGDSENLWEYLYDMENLQKIGVNRDAITEVLDNPRLVSLFTGYGDKPYDALYAFADLEPTVSEKLARSFSDFPENIPGQEILETVRDLKDPAVQETFIALLPGWTDSLEELADTAKLLAS